jgi:hypothetical protein
MQSFLDLFIFINCSTCFGRFLRPSSEAQISTYSVRYCQIKMLPAAIVDEMELSAPDYGRRKRLKHVKQFIEINRSRKSCVLFVVL